MGMMYSLLIVFCLLLAARVGESIGPAGFCWALAAGADLSVTALR